MARDILGELKTAKDLFVEYLGIVRRICLEGRTDLRDLEDRSRQELTQVIGRLYSALERLGVPLTYSTPAIGATCGIFEVALDADLLHPDKRHCIDTAIQVLNRAIGAVSAYTGQQREELIVPRQTTATGGASSAELESRLKSLEKRWRCFWLGMRWFMVVVVWAVIYAVFRLYGSTRWTREGKAIYAFLGTVFSAVIVALPMGRRRMVTALTLVFALLGGLLAYLQYFGR